jgi:hypothetical protein
MAIGKIKSGGKFPEGFVSPFKRVQMEERNDDALACIATISGKTLAEVTKLAVQLGYPEHGPAYVDQSLITKLLFNLGFNASDYKEVVSLDGIPDVAILMVDYQPAGDFGRHVVWHHVRGTPSQQGFGYVIDVRNWGDPKTQVTTNFESLKLEPAWAIEVTPRASQSGKAK